MDEKKIKMELSESEELIWYGHPKRRLFTKDERIRMPVSALLVTVFAVYWLLRQDVSVLMLFLVYLALLLVVYNTLVRFLIKIVQRNRTFYALTDERVLIFLVDKDKECKKTAETEIKNLSASVVVNNKDSTGSILFSEKKTIDMLPLKIGNNWPYIFGRPLMVFFDIEDPEKIHRIYKDLRKRIGIDIPESIEKPFSIYDE